MNFLHAILCGIGQLQSVLMLSFGWLIYRKVPTFNSVFGSIVIIAGIGLYIMAHYLSETSNSRDTNAIGVICSIVSLIAFAFYCYGQEIFLKQYKISPTIDIGMIGVYAAIIGSIPLLILNVSGHESINKIPKKSLLFIFGNSFLCWFYKYINWTILKKTSAFLFTTLFVLVVPLGLIAQIVVEKIESQRISFTWLYIIPIVLIIFGCVIVSWQNKEDYDPPEESLTRELNLESDDVELGASV